MQPRYCPKCGHQLTRDNFRFCPYCGHQLIKEPLTQGPSDRQESPNPNQLPSQSSTQENTKIKSNNISILENTPQHDSSKTIQPLVTNSYSQYSPSSFSQKIDITTMPIYKTKEKIPFFTNHDLKVITYYSVGTIIGLFFRFLLIHDSIPKIEDLLDFIRITILLTIIVSLALKYSFYSNRIFVKPKFEREYLFQVILATTFFLGYIPDFYNIKERKSVSNQKKSDIYTKLVLSLFVSGIFLIVYGILIYSPSDQNIFLYILFGENIKYSSVGFITGEILISTAFLLNLNTSFGYGVFIKEKHPKIHSFIRTGVIIILFLMLYSYAGDLFSIT